MAEEPETVAQQLVYADGRGWDKCLLVIVAHDASAVRTQVNRSPKKDWTGFNPKIQLVAMDVRESASLVVGLRKRATWFQSWHTEDGNPAHIKRELDVTDGFCQKVCEWYDQCLADGDGEMVAPDWRS